MSTVGRRTFVGSLGMGVGLLLGVRPGMARHFRDHVTVGQNLEPRSLDPRVGRDRYSLNVLANVYETLVRRDQKLGIVAALAESWEIKGVGSGSSSTDWSFRIRKDAKFHSGRAVDAKDVVYSLEQVRRPRLDMVQELVVEDPLKVRLRVADAGWGMLDALTQIFVVPAGFLDDAPAGSGGAWEKPIGSGPYKLVERVGRERIELMRNDESRYRGVEVRLLTFQVIRQKSTQVAAAASGDIQITDDPPTRSFADQLKASGITVEEAPGGMVFLGFNLNAPAVRDSRIRRALGMAIDRQKLARESLFSLAPAEFLAESPTAGGTRKAKSWEYDPIRAKRLLQEAGVATPAIDLATREDWLPLAEEVAKQLQAIGVQTSIKRVEFTSFVAALGQGTLGSSYLVPNAWPTDANRVFYPFLYSGGQFSSFKSAEADRLINEGRNQRDESKRVELAERLAELVKAEAPVIPLVRVTSVYGVGKGVRWKPRPDGLVLGSEIGLAK